MPGSGYLKVAFHYSIPARLYRPSTSRFFKIRVVRLNKHGVLRPPGGDGEQGESWEDSFVASGLCGTQFLFNTPQKTAKVSKWDGNDYWIVVVMWGNNKPWIYKSDKQKGNFKGDDDGGTLLVDIHLNLGLPNAKPNHVDYLFPSTGDEENSHVQKQTSGKVSSLLVADSTSGDFPTHAPLELQPEGINLIKIPEVPSQLTIGKECKATLFHATANSFIAIVAVREITTVWNERIPAGRVFLLPSVPNPGSNGTDALQHETIVLHNPYPLRERIWNTAPARMLPGEIGGLPSQMYRTSNWTPADVERRFRIPDLHDYDPVTGNPLVYTNHQLLASLVTGHNYQFDSEHLGDFIGFTVLSGPDLDASDGRNYILRSRSLNKYYWPEPDVKDAEGNVVYGAIPVNEEWAQAIRNWHIQLSDDMYLGIRPRERNTRTVSFSFLCCSSQQHGSHNAAAKRESTNNKQISDWVSILLFDPDTDECCLLRELPGRTATTSPVVLPKDKKMTLAVMCVLNGKQYHAEWKDKKFEEDVTVIFNEKIEKFKINHHTTHSDSGHDEL